MNTETIVLASIGFVSAFLIKAVLVWLFLRSWMQGDCRGQGPDYIRRHLWGPVAFWTTVTVGLLIVLLLLDIFYFSKHGTVQNVVRKVPGLSEWGDLGVLAWPLWAGAFLGLLLGAVAGVLAAVRGIPKRNLKCRRLFGMLAS